MNNGALVAEIRICDINIDGTGVRPIPDNFDEFTSRIEEFCTFISQTIKSPKKLAEIMAAKARLLETILEKAVTSDEETEDAISTGRCNTCTKSIVYKQKPRRSGVRIKTL